MEYKRVFFESRNKVMRNTSFLIMVVLMPLSGFTQEEHHMPGQHRHPEYSKLTNPIAKTETSAAQGRKLYEKNCIDCHGEAGKGGIGPDLTGGTWKHGRTDGEIFHVITDGVPGTAMKAFRNELSDEMRWHLVNYVSGLRKNEPTK